MELEILWTARFKEKFKIYNGVQDFVVCKTAEIAKKYKSNSTMWSYDLEKLRDKSFGAIKAYKVPVTRSDRLVFVIAANQLTLVDIGDHDVMDEYSRMPRLAREKDLHSSRKADQWFLEEIENYISEPKKYLTERSIKLGDILDDSMILSDSRWLYEAELNEDWIQFLDRDQSRVVDEILRSLSRTSNEMKTIFLMGGPGTGKTVVLLNLATRLANLGRAVSFQLNPQVEKYLKRGVQRVPGVNKGFGPGVTVLIDDPLNIDEFADALRRARANKCSAVIIGFDPLQWHERKMEQKFRQICENNRYEYFPLWKCYRQSFGVGKKSHSVLERIYGNSSRFIHEEKQLAERIETQPYLDLTLGMEFVDQEGRYVVYKTQILKRLEEEEKRVRSRIDLWSHTPAVCFVFDDELIAEYRKLVDQQFKGINRVSYPLSRYREIRGVEFQELFLFTTKEFWSKVNEGEVGLGKHLWEKITSLHTIFSRPKDSLVIFCV